MQSQSQEKPAASDRPKPSQKANRTRFGRRQGQQAPKKTVRTLNSDEDVPMLTYGPGNNFATFKDRISTACLEKFGDLGRLILLEEYWEPEPLSEEVYMVHEDPDDVTSPMILKEVGREQMKADVKERSNQMSKMRTDRAKMFAYLISKLSKESLDELKRNEGYEQVERTVCPLSLWKVIKSIHLVTTPSRIDVVVRRRAYDDYSRCRQGAFESISDFKHRHDMVYEAYVDQGNPPRTEEDQAMDFLESLDRSLYGEFVCEIINDVAKRTMSVPQNKNEVYVLATTRVTPRKATGGRNIGATYATIEESRNANPAGKPQGKGGPGKRGKGNGKKAPKDKPSKTPKSNGDEKENSKKGNCYNCGKPGHFARDCPDEPSDEAEDTPLAATTLSLRKKEDIHSCYFAENKMRLGPGDVILDNGSEVDIVHSKFLVNIRPGESGFRGLHGSGKKTSEVGYLPGFYECIACDDTHASVLSQSNIESLYKITYEQGSRYVVHMDERDLVFEKKGKLYVADMSEWIVTPEYYSLSTIAEKEANFSKKEVGYARIARDFIINAGYPSKFEAIHLVRDGNIENLPISVQDVKNAFAMYGDHLPAFYKGKMTESKVSSGGYWKVDRALREERRDQTLVTDVMTVEGMHFLLSVASPLEIVLQSHVANQTVEVLGTALQSQIKVLRSYGFFVRLVRVDPQRALVKLRGSFPGIEIDIAGAGDHLAKVDAKMRRIKDTCRAVLHGLPYKLPKELIPELVVYAVTRKNTARAVSHNTNVCPRTRMTGRKIDYKREFSLGFGNYCEVWSPKAKKNTMKERSESCIALYPSTNISGSWIFYRIDTGRQVRRTKWKQLPMTDRIINIMNSKASEPASIKDTSSNSDLTSRAVRIVEEPEESDEPVIVPNQTPTMRSMTAQEAAAEDAEVAEELQDYEVIPRGGDAGQSNPYGGDEGPMPSPETTNANTNVLGSEDQDDIASSESEDYAEAQEMFEEEEFDVYHEDPADWTHVDDPELEDLPDLVERETSEAELEAIHEEIRRDMRKSARIAAGSRKKLDPKSSSSSYLAFNGTNPHNHHVGTNEGTTSFCPYATCHNSPICGPCNQRFIFIAATGRSASTTLLKTMNALPKVRLAGENHGELNIASLVESNLLNRKELNILKDKGRKSGAWIHNNVPEQALSCPIQHIFQTINPPDMQTLLHVNQSITHDNDGYNDDLNSLFDPSMILGHKTIRMFAPNAIQ